MRNLDEVFKGKDTYIICSTLNQIVNYTPIKLMEKFFKDKSIKIFNITVEGESEEKSIFKRFDNSAWDENLGNILKEDGIKIYDNINIKRNECNDIIIELDKKILGKIKDGEDELNRNTKKYKKEKQSDKGIVWNITGGQRSTIFAIQKFIAHEDRDEDFIIYLEGNSNSIVCMKFNKDSKEFDYEVLEDKYWNDKVDLDLNTVFKLAGFNISNYENIINYLKPFEEYKSNDKFKREIEEYELCEKFYRFYKKSNDEDRKEFLNILINLNKSEKTNINQFIESFKQILKINDEEFNKEYGNAEDILIKMKGDSQRKFGYILEYMAIASMVNTVNIESNHQLLNYIVGIYHSVRLNRSENFFEERDTSQLCEFDVVLLTKSGQVVIFECKSGTMESDVGKSRKYTAYASAGIYGKPILITGLTKNDRIFINEKVFTKVSKARNQDEIDKLNEYDRGVLQSLRAAARANMEVWGLDEIGEKLCELYKEVLE